MTIINTQIFLAQDPTDHTHALTIKGTNNPAQTFILTLTLQDLTTLLHVRAPILDTWNNYAFMRLHLTSESLTWDPTLTLYKVQEAAMTNNSGHIVTMAHAVTGHVGNLVINALSSLTTDLANTTDDDNLYLVSILNVQILSVETSLNRHICLLKTTPINPQTIAIRWMISLQCAKHTVVMTTQRGVRTCLNPTLSCHFPTNDQMLHVLHTVFSNTMSPGSVP
jgi:hypothetical protein